MKIILQSNEGSWPSFKKIWLIMKLNFLLILITVLQVSASVSGQNTRFDLKMKNATIAQVFDEIERQSEVYFFYNKNQIDETRTVSVDYRNKTIDEILKAMVSDLNLTYEIAGKNIIIKAVEPTGNGLPQSGIKVKGVVKDNSGESLPGVTVLVKGTTNGTITDADGAYNLINVPGDATLVFSFVGMKKIEIGVGGKITIDAVLEDETIGIEEVVAIGYGTQKKKDLTGSIAAIGGELVAGRKVTQISQALQGAVSGVLVTRNGSSGAMGSSSIRIRGITTIGDSNPLVIVDGIPVSDVNQVNPADIETLTILKDAASASIYGSRAAAGVILITTKRAKTDQASVNYTFETGFDTPTSLPERMGAIRYMQLQNELRWNDGGNGANEYPTYSKELIDGYNANHALDPDKYPNTDMAALSLKNISPRETHMISIIGGSKFVKSNASVKYEKVGGFYDNKSYNRIFARTNNDFSISKIIGASFDLNFKRSITSDPTFDNVLNNIIIYAPVYPAIWADGRVAGGKTGGNVYGNLKYGGKNQNWYNQIGGKIAVDIKPIDGLKISGILAPIFDFNSNKNFMNRVDTYSATDPAQFAISLVGSDSNPTSNKLIEGRYNSHSLTTQLLVNYMKSIGSHDITALAGYENYYYKNESLTASRDQFLYTGYPYLDQGPLTYRDNSGSAYETAYRSFFGRLNYSFKSKYLIQMNVRYDGSSRFQSANRWGLFPSVSAGWVVSEENFMKNQSAVSFLKLRASWGALGNERIGNYPYLGIMSSGSALFYQNNKAIAQQTAAQVQYAIKDISWEKTESSDLGVDANFLNNRLRFTGDVYYKQTKDMLLALQIPIFVGFDNPNQNTGTMTTKGIDLDLSWNDKIGDLEYSASFNISQFQSKMGNLGGTEFLGDQVKKKGSEFNEWYGYISDGIYLTQEDVTNSPKLNSNVKIGDLKYRDISGAGGIPDGKISPEYDRVLLGSSQPQWMYGGNIKLGYKGIDFSLAFQGIGKQIVNSNSSFTDYNNSNWGTFPTNMDGKVWSKYNTDEQNLTAKYPRYTETNKLSNRAMSDFWLFNGGYFRLKNITLGYTIPQRITKIIRLDNIRVYASASDLWCISKYPKGYDPEGVGIVSTLLGGVSVTF